MEIIPRITEQRQTRHFPSKIAGYTGDTNVHTADAGHRRRQGNGCNNRGNRGETGGHFLKDPRQTDIRGPSVGGPSPVLYLYGIATAFAFSHSKRERKGLCSREKTFNSKFK